MTAVMFVLLLTLFSVVSLSPQVHCFPIADLSTTSDYRFGPHNVVTFNDGTIAVSLTSSYRISELGLHPDVLLPDDTSTTLETMLVLWINRRTGNVWWARALPNLQNTLEITQGIKGDIYVTGWRQNTQPGIADLCKLNAVNGDIVYCSVLPSKGPDGQSVEAPYLEYIKPDTLLMHAIKRTDQSNNYVATVNATSGAVRAYIPATPPGFQTLYTEYINVAAVNSAAGFVTSKERVRTYNGKEAFYDELYLHCVNHRKPLQRPRVHRLRTLPANTWPHHAAIFMERKAPGGVCTAEYVAYERALNFDYSSRDGDVRSRHLIVIRKNCSRTMREMAWESAGAPAPHVLKMSAPYYANSRAEIFGLRTIPGSSLVPLMFRPSPILDGTYTQRKGATILHGKPATRVHGYMWIHFLNGDGDTPSFVRAPTLKAATAGTNVTFPAPFTCLIVGDFKALANGRKLVVMGILQPPARGLGPVFSYDVAVPVS